MSYAGLKQGLLLAVSAWALTGAALEPEEQIQFADGLYARGMWEVALKEYQTCLESNTNRPGLDALYYRMGECYRSLGQTAEADRQYERATQGAPDSDFRFRAGLRRAELMEQVGRPADQIQLLVALLAQNPPEEFAAAKR